METVGAFRNASECALVGIVGLGDIGMLLRLVGTFKTDSVGIVGSVGNATRYGVGHLARIESEAIDGACIESDGQLCTCILDLDTLNDLDAIGIGDGNVVGIVFEILEVVDVTTVDTREGLAGLARELDGVGSSAVGNGYGDLTISTIVAVIVALSVWKKRPSSGTVTVPVTEAQPVDGS